MENYTLKGTLLISTETSIRLKHISVNIKELLML